MAVVDEDTHRSRDLPEGEGGMNARGSSSETLETDCTQATDRRRQIAQPDLGTRNFRTSRFPSG